MSLTMTCRRYLAAAQSPVSRSLIIVINIIVIVISFIGIVINIIIVIINIIVIVINIIVIVINIIVIVINIIVVVMNIIVIVNSIKIIVIIKTTKSNPTSNSKQNGQKISIAVQRSTEVNLKTSLLPPVSIWRNVAILQLMVVGLIFCTPGAPRLDLKSLINSKTKTKTDTRIFAIDGQCSNLFHALPT